MAACCVHGAASGGCGLWWRTRCSAACDELGCTTGGGGGSGALSAVQPAAVMAAHPVGGLGGALSVLALGHIDPNFSYWTTSGEFVFVAILAGYQSVIAVFVGSLLLELVRSFSSAYFPNTWQLALGIFLLLVIRFLPDGLGSQMHRLLPKRPTKD